MGDQSAQQSRTTSSSCATSRTATVPEAIKNNPHVAFRVDKLEPHLVDAEILIPPFIVGDFLEVVFVRKHNTIFEYMRYLKDGWFGK